MVMEAPPSPQCVGREFVRQYYTLLNKAPAHLHRFYNNNSSFVHGGLDAPNRETKPVVGQKQIHQKIQQLNFHDCHAKISQVDSQATLGDGVVVQVTGELSNSGQPMRRFTQTFVLAAQSPKKYYVHNDIFRYQDMIFSDEEVEQDSGRSEPEEDNEPELHSTSEVIQPRPQQPPTAATGLAYYNSTGPVPTGVSTTDATVPPATVSPAAPVSAVPPQQPTRQQPPQVQPQVAQPQPPLQLPLQQVTAAVPATTTVPPQVAPVAQQVPVAAVPVSNGTHPDDADGSPTPVAVTQEDPQLADSPEEHAADGDGATPDEDKVPQQDSLEDGQQLNESASSEPKTYATLVKCGGIGVGTSFATMATSAATPVKPTSSPHAVDSQPGSGGSGVVSQGQRGARARGGGGNIRGVVRPDRTSGAGRGSFADDNGTVGADGDRRRMGTNMQLYPDNQQLFLGNIPHHATEDDLRELFSSYGTIVNLRIHSKPNTGNRPNYGFIIFEEASTVQTLLNKRPIFFQEQKLNVEEKKTTNRLRLDQQGRPGGDSLPLGGGRAGAGGPRGGGVVRGGGAGLVHHRGGGRGGFGRGEGRGGGVPRGGYTRR